MCFSNNNAISALNAAYVAVEHGGKYLWGILQQVLCPDDQEKQVKSGYSLSSCR